MWYWAKQEQLCTDLFFCAPHPASPTLIYNVVVVNAVACKVELKDLSYSTFPSAGHIKSPKSFCLAVLNCSAKEDYTKKPLEFYLVRGLEIHDTMPQFS